jgi:23S rRNA (cytosine1962-C5)-methyltransferase
VTPPSIPRVHLKAGRDAALRRRHPWIFSGGIADVKGEPVAGALVAVAGADGDFLAWGHYSPASQIRVRVVSWDPDESPDTPEFWRGRLTRALALRESLDRDPSTNAYRLVNAESDELPGLIVDRYADTLVLQLLTVGTDARRALFADLLWDLCRPQAVYERSDVDVREREGLEGRRGLLRGGAPPSRIEIQESGLTYAVDIVHGHKTGFYLDQRENRRRFARLMASSAGTDAQMLNVFAYTGGFTICGLRHGVTHATNVDTSAEALAIGRDNLALNALDPGRVRDITGDAFEILRRLRRHGERFDAIVLDPPKFAFTQRDLKRASRGYKDINMQAIHLLRPGGLLFTFSCSGAISEDLFQKIVFGAALDTGRDLQIIGRLTQGSDHPVALTFPEAAYLKGLICRALA